MDTYLGNSRFLKRALLAPAAFVTVLLTAFVTALPAPALVFAQTAPTAPYGTPPPSIPAELDRMLSTGAFSGSYAGVGVYSISGDRLIYAKNGARAYVPASNMKLVIAGAALVRLGADYRFSTTLSADNAVSVAGVLWGNLYLQGTGDPTLSTADFARRVLKMPGTDLDRFAVALWRMGVRRVEGNLVGDETFFDTVRQGQGWKRTYNGECPPLSALTLNKSYRDLTRTRTVASPALTTVAVLKQRLALRGITVTGSLQVGKTSPLAKPVHIEQSVPLREIIKAMNKESDNFIAEQLLKHLGAKIKGRGTSLAGAAVAGEYLTSLGVAPGSVRVVDGSGLSPANRLTPMALLAVQKHLSGHPAGPYFAASLPIAGVDGTLKRRMREPFARGNVAAKTGYIKGASALSGYVSTKTGCRLAFSILLNRPALNSRQAKSLEDRIGQLLAGISLESPACGAGY